jgi:hypothetical protein
MDLVIFRRNLCTARKAAKVKTQFELALGLHRGSAAMTIMDPITGKLITIKVPKPRPRTGSR